MEMDYFLKEKAEQEEEKRVSTKYMEWGKWTLDLEVDNANIMSVKLCSFWLVYKILLINLWTYFIFKIL